MISWSCQCPSSPLHAGKSNRGRAHFSIHPPSHMHIVCLSAKTSSSASSFLVATAAASAFLSRTQLPRGDRQTANGQRQLASGRERLTKPKLIRRRKREARRSGISRFRSLGKGGVLLSEAHPIPSRAQMGPLPPFTLWADRSEMAERN